MRIELERLNELEGRFSHRYTAGELVLSDPEARLTGPAQIQGKVERRGNEVEVRGELRAGVEVGCGRCLKPVQIPVSAVFDERFTPAVSWRAEELHELTEEDLNLSVFDGEAIDLDDLVREEILLAIPGHVLCREDCQGLCPGCGIDRNVSSCQCEALERESRWKGLRELRS